MGPKKHGFGGQPPELRGKLRGCLHGLRGGCRCRLRAAVLAPVHVLGRERLHGAGAGRAGRIACIEIDTGAHLSGPGSVSDRIRLHGPEPVPGADWGNPPQAPGPSPCETTG